jgi:hypothetical protein
MKQRRPTRRKTIRQPRKQLPPARTPTDQPPPSRPQPGPDILSWHEPDPIGTLSGPLPLRAGEAAHAIVRDATGETAEARAAAKHEELLSQVSFIERLIAELPKQTPWIGHNAPPINDNDFRAIEGAIAVLKVQPVVPTAPDEARNAGLTLKIIGERIGTYLLKQGDVFVAEAAKSAGKEFGKRLVQAPWWWALAATLMLVANSVSSWLH